MASLHQAGWKQTMLPDSVFRWRRERNVVPLINFIGRNVEETGRTDKLLESFRPPVTVLGPLTAHQWRIMQATHYSRVFVRRRRFASRFGRCVHYVICNNFCPQLNLRIVDARVDYKMNGGIFDARFVRQSQ